MKVLFTTQPGVGHFNPLAPIAHALEAAGHTTRVACAASFAPRVERAGLTPLIAGIDWLETSPELAFPEVEEMTTRERELFLTDIFSDTTANYMTHDLLESFADWRPDVIVRDTFEYGGCLAGEVAGIPHAVVNMEFYIPSHVTRQGMESQLAYLRSAYGLPPYPAMEMLTRYLYFSYVPNSYQFPEYTLPENTHVLRPAFLDPSGDEVLPDWVATLPDQPTVYASMGTTFNNVPDIFRTIIAGLADEPVNLIITVGRSQDPRQFDPLPEHVYVEQFIPQAALMPYCDLVMANGGVGTLMIALTYDLPLIVIPLAGHLLLHAQRVRQLGIGQSLKLPPAWLDVGDAANVDNYVARQASGLVHDTAPELSPETVRSVVREVLEAASYKEEVERLRQEIVRMPGPESAVPLLEQLGTRSEG